MEEHRYQQLLADLLPSAFVDQHALDFSIRCHACPCRDAEEAAESDALPFLLAVAGNDAAVVEVWDLQARPLHDLCWTACSPDSIAQARKVRAHVDAANYIE